jgi:hypothetical protein
MCGVTRHFAIVQKRIARQKPSKKSLAKQVAKRTERGNAKNCQAITSLSNDVSEETDEDSLTVAIQDTAIPDPNNETTD